MKKIMIAVAAVSLAVSLFSIASASNKEGMMGGGCSKCAQQQGSAPVGPMQKFQADTIDLRQEMMNKRFDLQRENLKGVPDEAKVAALRADIKAIQAKILAIRAQSGLPTDKCDGECNQKMGGFEGKGMGGCGKGMGGCGNGPCGAPK